MPRITWRKNHQEKKPDHTQYSPHFHCYIASTPDPMKVYYLYDGKQQNGPYSLEELKDKSLNQNTLVWTDQLNDWTKAGDIEALKPLFTQPVAKSKGIPPPPPTQRLSKTSN